MNTQNKITQRSQHKGGKSLIVLLAVLSLIISSNKANAEEKVVKPVNFVKVTDEGESSYGTPGTATKSVVEKNQPAAPVEYYPDGALRQAYEEEMREWKNAEEKELQAIKAREDYERRKVDAEHEIASKKFRINEYKMKQEKAAFDVDMVKTEIGHLDKQQQEVEAELVVVEKIANEQISKSEASSRELETRKKDLTNSLEKLRYTRDEAARSLNKMQIDMQKMRADISVIQADIARTENEKERYESDKNSYMQAYQKVQLEKARTLAELEEMRSRLNVVKTDFNKARQDFEKAKKDQVAFENMARNERLNISTSIKKFKADTQQMANLREDAIASRERMETDIQKMKTELAIVKAKNDDTRQKMTEENAAVMESRLALEEAKTDLTEEMATGATGRYKHDTMGFKMRSLASVTDTSEMVPGDSKPWVVKKSCDIVKSPSSRKKMGSVKKDDRLIASPADSGYVKILNSSGQAAFVSESCGDFAE